MACPKNTPLGTSPIGRMGMWTSFVLIHFNGEEAKLAMVTLIVSNGEGHTSPATFPLKGKGSSG